LTLNVIDNLDLDKIQRGWLQILQDTIQAPQKVNRDQTHDDKDTRKIWKELSEYYDLDVAHIQSGKISTY
jgi:hypothetical protein